MVQGPSTKLPAFTSPTPMLPWANLTRNVFALHRFLPALPMSSTKLVLHFDINKTIIMVDPAGGLSMRVSANIPPLSMAALNLLVSLTPAMIQEALNSIIAYNVWGEMSLQQPSGPPTWRCLSETPSVSAPALTGRFVPQFLFCFSELYAYSQSRSAQN